MKGNPYETTLESGVTVAAAIGADYEANRANGMSNEDNIEALLETWGATLGERAKKRSLVSKLTRDGFYVKDAPAPKQPKDEGPSKKDLLKTLRDLTGRDFTGLDAATKDAIKEVIDLAQSQSNTSETEAA